MSERAEAGGARAALERACAALRSVLARLDDEDPAARGAAKALAAAGAELERAGELAEALGEDERAALRPDWTEALRLNAIATAVARRELASLAATLDAARHSRRAVASYSGSPAAGTGRSCDVAG